MRSTRTKGTSATVFVAVIFSPRPSLYPMFCGTTVSLGCRRVTGLFVIDDPSWCNRCMNPRQRGCVARVEDVGGSKTGAVVPKKKLTHMCEWIVPGGVAWNLLCLKRAM